MSNGTAWNIGSSSTPEPTLVTVLVNGEDMAEVAATEKLGDVVQRFAREAGIQTAAVFNGEQKLSAHEASKTLGELGLAEIDIRTKDARA